MSMMFPHARPDETCAEDRMAVPMPGLDPSIKVRTTSGALRADQIEVGMAVVTRGGPPSIIHRVAVDFVDAPSEQFMLAPGTVAPEVPSARMRLAPNVAFLCANPGLKTGDRVRTLDCDQLKAAGLGRHRTAPSEGAALITLWTDRPCEMQANGIWIANADIRSDTIGDDGVEVPALARTLPNRVGLNTSGMLRAGLRRANAAGILSRVQGDG